MEVRDNSKRSIDIPFYMSNLLLYFATVVTVYIIYIGQIIILPLIFSIIFSILLNPIVNFLIRKKINRIVAIILVLVISIAFLAAIIFFIFYEMSMFADKLPLFKEKFYILIKDLFDWIGSTFGLSSLKIKSWIKNMTSQGMPNGSAILGQVTSVLRTSVNVLLVPIYLFLILLYKDLLLSFIRQIFSKNNHTVADVLTETKSLIQQYIVGLLFEAGIFTILTSVALGIIGVEYAIMFGVISALLNLIPYIGAFIAMILAVSFTFLTKSPSSAFFVFLSYTSIQFIDNNFVVPKIVASKVKINPLASIIVVLIGGELFGIAGMFLSIPLTAIMKVVFDRVERLKPIGFLLGDTNGASLSNGLFKQLKIKKKQK